MEKFIKLTQPPETAIGLNICDLTKLRAVGEEFGCSEVQQSETVKLLLCSLTEGKTEF
jgi:hypothetical protein